MNIVGNRATRAGHVQEDKICEASASSRNTEVLHLVPPTKLNTVLRQATAVGSIHYHCARLDSFFAQLMDYNVQRAGARHHLAKRYPPVCASRTASPGNGSLPWLGQAGQGVEP